ncbi:MAG: hypothetical protein ACRDBG_25045 [Waterburya sp.]
MAATNWIDLLPPTPDRRAKVKKVVERAAEGILKARVSHKYFVVNVFEISFFRMNMKKAEAKLRRVRKYRKDFNTKIHTEKVHTTVLKDNIGNLEELYDYISLYRKNKLRTDG